MADSLAKEVEGTSKIDENSARDNSSAMVSTICTTSSAKEHADKTEAAAIEVNSDSVQDTKTIELREQLEKAEVDLASLPEGHESTSEKLSRLADCMVKYYHAVGVTAKEPFLEAFGTAAQARDHLSADDFAQSLAMYMQMVCCYSIYDVTEQVNWLRKSVTFGRESLDRMKDAAYADFDLAYSVRCEHLAEISEKLFQVEGLAEDIATATVFQGECVDHTHPEQYPDQSGVFTLYYRYKKWVALYIKSLDKKPNLMIDAIQGLIDQVSEKLPCSLIKDDHIIAHDYWFIRLGLYYRLWAKSKDVDHFNLLRRNTRELLEWEANDPFCTCHDNKDDPTLSTDSQNALHLVRRAAGFFDEWFDLDNDDSEWSKHLETINTSISLWEETSMGTSRLNFADLKRDLRPTIRLQDRYRQKYLITESPRAGWRADDKTWETSCINVLLNIAEDQQLSPSDSIQPLLEGPRMVTFGSSNVAPELFSVHGVIEVGKPWNLDSQRFKFVDRKAPLTADRWIRQRSDNGKFILGGARKGRDDDIFEFIANYDKPVTAKSASEEEAALVDGQS